jgi:hypothetical protein
MESRWSQFKRVRLNHGRTIDLGLSEDGIPFTEEKLGMVAYYAAEVQKIVPMFARK